MIFAKVLELSRSSTPFLISIFALVVPITLYLLWRLWQFTLRPLLHPEEPRELPYTIPYVGHGLEYVNNGQQLIDRAREYLGDTREPFALTCGGNKLYFLTDSSDVASMFKNTVTLDFMAIVKPLILMFGMSQEGIDLSFHMPPSAAEDPVNNALELGNSEPKPVMRHTSELTHKYLLPGPEYTVLEQRLVESLRFNLTRHALDPYYVQSNTEEFATVSLFNWTSFVLGTAVSDALFGPKLARGNVALLKAFGTFGKSNWKLWYGWKDADDVRNAKVAYVAEIDKYLKLTAAERGPEESEFWQKMEKAYVASGLSSKDITERAGLLFWVSNSNPARLCFWILNFLLFRKELFDHVKAELHAAMPTPTSPLNMQKLLNDCPYVNAVIEETLRLTVGGSSVRVVTDPTGLQIGGKVIPCGARLFAPPLQLHTNEKVWPNAREFQPERWLKNPKGKLHDYKPFGGGITFCPGRFLAKSSIRSFLAIALARFEMELEPGQVQVGMKTDEPVQGPMYPVDGMDLKLRLRYKG